MISLRIFTKKFLLKWKEMTVEILNKITIETPEKFLRNCRINFIGTTKIIFILADIILEEIFGEIYLQTNY